MTIMCSIMQATMILDIIYEMYLFDEKKHHYLQTCMICMLPKPGIPHFLLDDFHEII